MRFFLKRNLKNIWLHVQDLSVSDWEAIDKAAKIALENSAGLSEAVKKRQIINLIYDGENLRALFSYDVDFVEFQFKPIQVVFAGQAWIHKDYRGFGLLQRSLSVQYSWAKLRSPFRELYLFMGITSYKSFMALNNSRGDFYPKSDIETPEGMLALTSILSRKYFQRELSTDQPFVHPLGTGRSFVKKDSYIPDALLQHPSIREYLKLNPNYENGDRLLTLLAFK